MSYREPSPTLIRILMAVIITVPSIPHAGDRPIETPSPFPVGHRFVYNIKFMAFHCGRMTLESFTTDNDGAELYHVVMTARSSRFFDGIYRVRSRIESWFDPRTMSTVRYHSISNEKKDHTDDLFELDLEAGEIRRDKNGEVEVIPFEASGGVHDPLAYLFRLRTMVGEPGGKVALTLMTSDGAVETIADMVERKRIKTALGKREAVRLVPRPKDDMLFAKRGKMSLWYGTAGAGIPYRVVFDLAFGKLTAKLIEVHEMGPDDLPSPLPE